MAANRTRKLTAADVRAQLTAGSLARLKALLTKLRRKPKVNENTIREIETMIARVEAHAAAERKRSSTPKKPPTLAPVTIRALTVRQPFAWQIMTGAKTIEYRSWDTDYCGAMLIHVSSKVKLTRAEAARWPAADVYSVIIGSVVLDHIEGRPGDYQWHLRAPRPLAEPIPCTGRLQLWKPSEAVLAAIPDLDALLAADPPTKAVPPPPSRPKTSDELVAEFIGRRRAERAAAATSTEAGPSRTHAKAKPRK